MSLNSEPSSKGHLLSIFYKYAYALPASRNIELIDF